MAWQRYNSTSKIFEYSTDNGVTWNPQGLDASIITQGTLAAARVPDITPIGTIHAFGGSVAPTGYLICDGSSLLRAGTYAGLFSVIGTAYGSVDGTHFTLPDLRGKFALGKSTAGTGNTLGASGGNIDHNHSIPGLSVPSLSVPGLSIPSLRVLDYVASLTWATSSIGINSAFGQLGWFDGAGFYKVGSGAVADTASAHPAGIESGGVTGTGTTGTGTTGTGTSGTNNPPFQTVNYIIKY